MTREEFEKIRYNQGTLSILVSDLENQNDRTLLFGYTCNRDTFHVYLKDGNLHRVIYDFKKNIMDHIHGKALEVWTCIPNKRTYPERTDLEFTQVVMNKGYEMMFTSYVDGVEEQQFYGKIAEDLT